MQLLSLQPARNMGFGQLRSAQNATDRMQFASLETGFPVKDKYGNRMETTVDYLTPPEEVLQSVADDDDDWEVDLFAGPDSSMADLNSMFADRTKAKQHGLSAKVPMNVNEVSENGYWDKPLLGRIFNDTVDYWSNVLGITGNSSQSVGNDFNSIVEDIIISEGGYVNHPNDSGGPTNKGVTLSVFKENAKGLLSVEPTLDNLKNLTDDQAKVIYKTLYWDTIGGDQINNKGVAHLMFDMAINSGQSTAVKQMQKTLNAMGNNLNVDGIIGPKTIDTINSVKSSEQLFNNFKETRLQFYKDIIQAKPKYKVFEDGWINRLNNIQY